GSAALIAGAGLIALGEKFLQFRPVLRALADDPGPAGFVGLVAIGLARRAVERDRLNAGLGLTFGVPGVLFGENGRRIPLRLLPCLAQKIALRIVELVPGGLVHQDRNLGGIES